MNSNVSLLINSCDAYKDVLTSQLNLLNHFGYLKYFNDRIYINTESVTSVDIIDSTLNIIFLKTKSDTWGERLINSLELINTEYVFVLFDDYFPKDQFSRQLIDLTTEFLAKSRSDCAILSPVLDLDKNSKFLNQNFRLVPKTSLYRVNSAPAIWKTKSLLKTLSRKDDPWVWECFSMYRTEAKKLQIISVDESSEFQYRYSYKSGGAVYRGSWVKAAFSSYTEEVKSLIVFGNRHSIDGIEHQPRSLKWKVNFLLTGLKSSGIAALHFFIVSLMITAKKKYLK